MRLAPEGLPFIAAGGALAAAAVWSGARWGGLWWAVAALLALLEVWLLVFFRDPDRAGPRGDRYVLAPAEGRVVHVTEVDEPTYLKARAVRISIFLSVFDVHVNRYPVSGRIELVRYNPGKFLHAATEKASLDNEQSSVGIQGPHGALLVRQIAGLVARRIVTDGRVGEAVVQATRMGMIRFGSRTDVFIPLDGKATIKVKPGDTARVGATVLAEYSA
jgi:phosphatidylserine decarboxylase